MSIAPSLVHFSFFQFVSSHHTSFSSHLIFITSLVPALHCTYLDILPSPLQIILQSTSLVQRSSLLNFLLMNHVLRVLQLPLALSLCNASHWFTLFLYHVRYFQHCASACNLEPWSCNKPFNSFCDSVCHFWGASQGQLHFC